ncbi:MAG TPA: hypothetical protein VFN74_15400, partial [Chloroflexota bacterium]|nr:hypothetical protein [Chloroflexota bacterium]
DLALAAAYEVCAELHNALDVTDPLPTRAGLFHNRPFHVLDEGRLVKALTERIQDPAVKRLTRHQHLIIGNTTQWADSTDALSSWWYDAQRALYRAHISDTEAE